MRIMIDIIWNNEYWNVVGLFSWLLPTAWLIVMGLCEFGQYLYNWITDNDPAEHNLLVQWFMLGILEWHISELTSFKYQRHAVNDYLAQNLSNGHAALFYPIVVLGIAPVAIFISIVYYPITIGIVVCIGLAHLARLLCRTKSMMQDHIDNHNK